MSDVFVKIGAASYAADDYTVPADRTFRAAWEADETAEVISVDMDAAREVWREKIRKARIEPLAALDTAFMRALEAGEDTSAIVTQKQVLRDAPALDSIDLAETPEDLMAVQPIPNVTIV